MRKKEVKNGAGDRSETKSSYIVVMEKDIVYVQRENWQTWSTLEQFSQVCYRQLGSSNEENFYDELWDWVKFKDEKNTARGHVDEIKHVQALTNFEANITHLAVDTLSIFKSFRLRFLDKIIRSFQMKRRRVITFRISVVIEQKWKS